jgi:hypothetical protein
VLVLFVVLVDNRRGARFGVVGVLVVAENGSVGGPQMAHGVTLADSGAGSASASRKVERELGWRVSAAQRLMLTPAHTAERAEAT